MDRLRFKKVYKDDVGAKAGGLAAIGTRPCGRCGIEATRGYLHDTKKTVVCESCSRYEDVSSAHWVPTVDLQTQITVDRLKQQLRALVIGKLRRALKPRSGIRGKTLESPVHFTGDAKADRKIRKAICEKLGL